ncbi:SMP-30/gluconolactonase/LRE family protein [Thalassotalea litorea]|uniref:SMP-30/gluconolactonase/LRE family protein n=2 Tax=Thalassotalea litorea TaxID=2020715 RepID=A0A5R9IZS1_9GAMM|nr:SMP-30/gluconolactonase/LRE family protein [Thalassotalea litorea]
MFSIKVVCLALVSFTAVSFEVVVTESTDWTEAGEFTTGIEGPAVNKAGELFAVNYQSQGTIGRVTGKNEIEKYLDLPDGSVGNGIRFDQAGNMYIADYVNHNILKVAQGSKEIDVYAHSSEMNQPNDIAIMENGILFASDPNWAENTGNLWRIDLNGDVVLLESGMGTTNGIEVSPDNERLYVNESIQRKIWVYDLSPEGEISNKRLFVSFDDFGLDGMRTDNKGNLYIARYGAGFVLAFDPSGKLIHKIQLKGDFPTNVAFGGKDGKQVFVTMQKRGSIETFQNNIPGRNY